MTLKVNFYLNVYFRIYNETQFFINSLFSCFYKTNFHYMKVKHVLKFVSFETLHRHIEDPFYLKMYENKNYL